MDIKNAAAVTALIQDLLGCIRAQRSAPASRASVRAAILRVRQLRGLLEVR